MMEITPLQTKFNQPLQLKIVKLIKEVISQGLSSTDYSSMQMKPILCH